MQFWQKKEFREGKKTGLPSIDLLTHNCLLDLSSNLLDDKSPSIGEQAIGFLGAGCRGHGGKTRTPTAGFNLKFWVVLFGRWAGILK